MLGSSCLCLACVLVPIRPSSLFLGGQGPPFIGQGGALGQPEKEVEGFLAGRKPLSPREEATWLILLQARPCVVAIILWEKVEVVR